MIALILAAIGGGFVGAGSEDDNSVMLLFVGIGLISLSVLITV